MLSICLITKNEEKNIARCLNSIKSIADEVIVVDTGSTDETINIAKSFGCQVYYHPWNNDFSESRNFALDKCTKDWIFSIDADEELYIEHANLLKNLLSNTNKEAFYLRLINLIGDISINETSSLRIFRNRKNYRYTGRLHEQIYLAIENNSPTKDCFEVTSFILNHYGYDHNNINMDEKIKRNIKVLECYQDHEKDGFYYYSLGNEYQKLSDPINAKECFVKALNTPSQDYGFRPYLAVSLGEVCLNLKNTKDGLNYIQFFKKEMPDFRDLYFLEAVFYNELMDYSNSYSSLIKFTQSIPNLSKYPSFNFEQDNDVNGLLSMLKSLSEPNYNDNY